MTIEDEYELARLPSEIMDWGEVIDFLNPAPSLPPFPLETLGPILYDWASATVAALEVPEALVGCAVLGVMSAAVAGRLDVMVKRDNGWKVTANLYLAPVAAPGERKSAVLDAAVKPLEAAEILLRETYDWARAEQVAAMRTRAEKYRKEAGRADTEDERTDALSKATELINDADAIDPGAVPNLWTTDVTPERLEDLMVEQQGRFALLSDEGGALGVMAGRYSSGAPNIDVFLKGQDGGQMRVERISRRSIIDSVRLTVLLMLQPSQLRQLLDPELVGRGLTARFLVAWPDSKVGTRRMSGAPIDQTVEAAYRDLVRDLIVTQHGLREPVELELSSDAYAELEVLHGELEPRLHQVWGDLADIGSAGSKLTGNVASIAGLLHVADPAWGDRAPVINGETMRRAVEIGRFFVPQLLHAFGTVAAAGPAELLATRFLKWLVTHPEFGPVFDNREAYRKMRVPAEDMIEALEFLAQHRLARAVGPKWELRPAVRNHVTEVLPG